ncbi:MAG: ParB/RepB/Spo0J family partition protein [Chloroflexi bacterium]|nr:ParB/RepB/Spo0J family partition protein [Chloroflexota bacterium]
MDTSFVSEGQSLMDDSGLDGSNSGSHLQSGSDVCSPSTSASPVLKSIRLHLITAVRNPRHTPPTSAPEVSLARTSRTADAVSVGDGSTSAAIDPGLDGLARSLGSQEAPRLAEPPIVQEMPGGRYRLCAGKRRVEAARLAGWTDILCLVHPPMDSVYAHRLSLMENMQRLPMHPLEEISALCISRLLANADARGLGEEARRLLEDAWQSGSSSYTIMLELDRVLKESGWVAERPDVTWKAHLDDLGISMAPWERKRKLRMLNIDPALLEQLQRIDITEASLRSLGTLNPEDQQRVVEALVANPSLARKVRRIARARRDGFYTSIEDALAEVQGFSCDQSTTTPAPDGVPMSTELSVLPWEESSEQEHHIPAVPSSPSGRAQNPALQEPQVSPEIQDAVLQLLECADRLSEAMSSLQAYRGGAMLPQPWGVWSSDALSFIEGLLPGQTAGSDAHFS